MPAAEPSQHNRPKDEENRQGETTLAGGTELASQFPLLRCAAVQLEFKKNAALSP
jgi:hypothetical protein